MLGFRAYFPSVAASAISVDGSYLALPRSHAGMGAGRGVPSRAPDALGVPPAPTTCAPQRLVDQRDFFLPNVNDFFSKYHQKEKSFLF